MTTPRRPRFAVLALYPVFVVLACLAVLLVVELGGQVYGRLHPAYEVLHLQPDRAVGWRLVPNLKWTWAGLGWYARYFSVEVENNADGFRDRPRRRERPEGVTRVAMLGDSMIEAAQVPLEKTAGQILERRRGPSFEVLNFGVSGYGVGQCLLAWETYARAFRPRYVFLLSAGYLMERTVQASTDSLSESARGRGLRVRPTFRLDGDRLVRVRAADYDAFVSLQQERIRAFGGARMRRREPGLFLGDYLGLLWPPSRVLAAVRARLGRGRPLPPPRSGPEADTAVDVGIAVIAELGRSVAADGGRLVVLDASRHFDPSAGALEERLRELCRVHELGYIPLSDALRDAREHGRRVKWGAYDAHFNEAGNEVLAEAMGRWLDAEAD